MRVFESVLIKKLGVFFSQHLGGNNSLIVHFFVGWPRPIFLLPGLMIDQSWGTSREIGRMFDGYKVFKFNTNENMKSGRFGSKAIFN